MRRVFATPDGIEELQDIISHQNEMIHVLDHYQDNSWELFRLMTDDDDTLQWYFVDDVGVSYDVDVRATAEDISLAFVYKNHMVHDIHYSPSDNRNFITVHIHSTGENKNYYLFQR